jgi:hypothetical protein
MSKIKINPLKIWECLEIGMEVEIGDYTYSIQEDENGKKILCYNFQREFYEEGQKKVEPHYVRAEILFDDFIEICQKIKEDDYFILVSNLSLTKIARSGKKY